MLAGEVVLAAVTLVVVDLATGRRGAADHRDDRAAGCVVAAWTGLLAMGAARGSLRASFWARWRT
jgi:hypothetical protein